VQHEDRASFRHAFRLSPQSVIRGEAPVSMAFIPLFGVSFVDAHRGWVVGGAGTILATADGATFAHQVNGDPALNDLLGVVFVDANVGFAVGTSGTILKTTDGGANWVIQSSGGSTAQLFAVDFVNENTGFAVGRNGTILSTSNGGQDWHAQSSGTSTAILLDVKFIQISNRRSYEMDPKSSPGAPEPDTACHGIAHDAPVSSGP
jgi:photosystem II stability/assembly factor-like uncharacterized protein